MKYTLPGELWNQVEVPMRQQTATNVSTFLSEMAYKLASITDVMMVKEFWHTVCDFAERCGALRERIYGTIKSSSLELGPLSPVFGEFQRFVGAGVDNVPVSLDVLSTKDTASGPVLVFDSSCTPVSDAPYAVYVDVSVVPDIYAVPEKQTAPLWFLNKYDKALMSGTLMRIYAMEGEKWSDSAGARMNATTYLREINRITHGLITAGMRRQVLVDAESILARQSITTNSQTQTNTVG
ncbi:MAG: hypothetical protein ACI4QT_04465 [Kiritimatiellia bacterium]